MTSLFRAAVLVELNKPLRIMNILFPKLQYGQVLVKIKFSTVCASQRFEVTGLRGVDRFLPHLLGHEGFGVVADVGPGVTRFEEGDEVILTWIKQSGLECHEISYLNDAGIKINSGRISTFSEFAVVSENRLFAAPKVGKQFALPLLGCAALTGAGIVAQSPCNSGRGLVIGAGGVGMFTIIRLLSEGVQEIHVIERSKKRREFLKSLSEYIACYFSTSDPKFTSEVAKGGLFREVYEVSGDADLLQKAVELTDTPGILTFASHPENGKRVSIDPHELIRGKEIKGSWGGGCTDERLRHGVTELFVKSIDMVCKQISEPFRLEDINLAFDDSISGMNARTLIKM